MSLHPRWQCREIDESEIQRLERKLTQALELTVSKKKRLVLANMQLHKAGAEEQLHAAAAKPSLVKRMVKALPAMHRGSLLPGMRGIGCVFGEALEEEAPHRWQHKCIRLARRSS